MKTETTQVNDAHYRVLVENLRDYALILMDTEGRIRSWNRGAERLLGYTQKEILGRAGKIFFTKEDVDKGEYKKEIGKAIRTGRSEDERWHVRKGGSVFWGSGVMFSIREKGKVTGL